MVWKKLAVKLIFPPLAVLFVLLPTAAVLLVYAMVRVGTQTPVAYTAYVLAAYTLTVWCVRVPFLMDCIKKFKNENRYVQRWLADTHLRINVSLYGSLLWNTAYAAFQLGLSLYHRTFWFGSLAGYYFCLAVMRFFLVRHTRRHRPGERMQSELVKYRACGILLLFMNLVLAIMIFFMVYWNRTFVHHEITTITMAAYTFTALAVAIVHAIQYRKYNSPVYSASKAISLAAACVSMLTLESTMLTTFGNDTMPRTTQRILLGTSGAAVSVFIITMAVYMIVQSNKKLYRLNAIKEQING